MKLISADPGLHGALIYWGKGRILNIEDMPTTKLKSKNIVDYNIVAGRFNKFKPDVIVIEHVGSSPKGGKSSMFNFGMGFGILLGAAAGSGAKVETISPQKWKAATGLLKKPKDASVDRALALYPEIRESLFGPRGGKRVDIADALLIGHTYIMFNGG